MDLHLSAAEKATDDEKQAVDAVLGPPETGWDGGPRTEADGHAAIGGHAARDRRHLLIEVLHAIQDRAGWISPGALDYACERLTVPPAEAYGVASFYEMFRTEPSPDVVVHVCDDIACQVNGAEALCERMDGTGVAWERGPCLGQCDRAPAALVIKAGPDPSRVAVAPADPEKILACRTDGQRLAPSQPSLGSYRAAGGYEMLRRAFALGPAGVVREVRDAKLLGRGGAAFPTAVKWEAVAANPVRPHYVVANADESEPGTFKDRVLMEQDPFAVVEALTIMGYACGAEQGYLYIRGEYPLAETRLAHALAAARSLGFLGDSVMGSGYAFDIEIRRGAGAYIAGEETALLNSLEGKRAEPRNKPPFPAQHGLFGKPTAVNNVETLLAGLEILRVGGPAYAATGTPGSTGRRMWCLSGCVERPGVYEHEFGATLGEVLDGAGGVRGGRPLQAILLGGAAGAFVGPDALGMPLTFEAARAAGVTLGSGVVLVLDDTVSVPALLTRIARFFRDESCGQCVPCRVGTVRQEELLARVASGVPVAGERALFADISAVTRDASICGLGQTATSAVDSAIRLGLLGGPQ